LEGNIKIDLVEAGCKDGRWIELAEDRVETLGALKFGFTARDRTRERERESLV
jgi:hypothetical protein